MIGGKLVTYSFRYTLTDAPVEPRILRSQALPCSLFPGMKLVDPLGFEPRTRGLKARCSTY